MAEQIHSPLRARGERMSDATLGLLHDLGIGTGTGERPDRYRQARALVAGAVERMRAADAVGAGVPHVRAAVSGRGLR